MRREFWGHAVSETAVVGRWWLPRLDLSVITKKAIKENDLGIDEDTSPFKYAANSEQEDQIIPLTFVRVQRHLGIPKKMSRKNLGV